MPTPATKDEALAALQAAAQPRGDRQAVHSLIHALGVEWDLTDALNAVTHAATVEWADLGELPRLLGHPLVVTGHSGLVVAFEVKR